MVESGDLLDGARAIEEFLQSLGLQVSERQVYHMAATGEIPSFRLRRRVVASKSEIMKVLRQRAAGEHTEITEATT